MNILMRIFKRIIRTLFPDVYLRLKARRFDTSTVIYKKMTYKAFLEQAFRDFRPELSLAERKELEYDILRVYLGDQTRPDEYLLYRYDRKSESERKEYLPQASKDSLLISYYKGDIENTIGQLTLLGIKCIDRFGYIKDIKSIYKTDERFSKERLRVGKFKCEVLKSIRVHAAECNNIPYTPHDCEHKVCATGCCPMCDKELARITKEYYRTNNRT